LPEAALEVLDDLEGRFGVERHEEILIPAAGVSGRVLREWQRLREQTGGIGW
jgi:hypothetical protein